MTRIQSYALGEWVSGGGQGTPLFDAVTGEEIGVASSEGLDLRRCSSSVAPSADPRSVVSRSISARARSRRSRSISRHARKISIVSPPSRARRRGDSWIDIDGGIGTLFAYASRGRREFPDETFYVDGGPKR